MLKRIVTAVIVVAMLASGAVAGPFEVFLAHYQRDDFASAVRHWTPLAEQGDAQGQATLGAFYDYGWGVPQDYAEAARWYRLAAEQGYAAAQNNLGLLYDNGQGVPQNILLAYVWLSLAFAQGYDDGSASRDLASSRMTAEQLAEAQRLATECFNSNYQNCP